MEDKERANMVLKRIGEMPYFDPEAIVKVLVNEFELVRKEAAQQSVQPTCSTCGEKLRSGDIWWNECEKCHSKIASG